MTRKAPYRTTQKAMVLGLGALGLAATLTSGAILAEGPAATAAVLRQPADDEVMAQVEAQDRAQSRAVRQLAAGDVRARVALARRWMERARDSSDPRHLGRAQAALAPYLGRAQVPHEVRLVRAQIAQSLHDFAGARADFDQLAAERPDDLAIQLGRAAVATVTGDYDAALASCDALTATAPALLIVACKAPVQLVRGGAEQAYRELTEQSRLAADAAPRVASWVATLQGELAASLGDTAAAERHLRASLAIASDTYTKVALADLYLATDRPQQVLELLAPAGGDAAQAQQAQEIDGLLLRLAIAQQRLGLPAAADSASKLRERLAATVARGDFTHRREQGLFELDVEGRPTEALALLIENWKLQKEPIDALLLLRAAAAARQPQAAAPVRAWIEQHQVTDHAIQRAAAALAAAGAAP